MLICLRWLHALFVAIDANFRLKHRLVSKDTINPSLSRGWSYFVEELSYKLYISEHSNTCQEVIIIISSGSMELIYSSRKVLAQVTTQLMPRTRNHWSDLHPPVWGVSAVHNMK